MDCQVLFQAWKRDFYLLLCVQIGSGIHPASYSIANAVLSPVIKRPGREAHKTDRSRANGKNSGAIPPFPYTPL
jgi:hypothetical protein